jgi:ABC-type antimicrobial peptide transport system permease subunit
MAGTSFTVLMLGIAGSMALTLGLVGMYGVISYSVSQRKREIGIRIALGARQREINWSFVRHGLMLASIGIVSGLFGAVLFTRLMSSLLFGVRPLDPLTLITGSALMLGAAILASYIPARRTSYVDPVEALRIE